MKIFIKGMMCEHCAAHVTQALMDIEGLSAVHVNLQEEFAETNGTAAHDVISKAIEEEGYDVVRIED